jgi:diguanylate cyclase (GGDEF)-like protein
MTPEHHRLRTVLIRSLLKLFLYRFIVPGALLVVTAMALRFPENLPEPLPAFVQIYPYGVFIVGILLGLGFNRSRPLFAILVLALVERSLLRFPPWLDDQSDVGEVIFRMAGILLPLNLVWLSLLTERGTLTLRGAARLGLIVVQAVCVAFLCRVCPAWTLRALEIVSFDIRVGGAASSVGPAQAAFVGAFLFLLFRFLTRPDPIEGGFLWGLVGAFTGLYIAPLYFSTAGLIIVVSILAASHSMAFLDELTGLPGRRALNEFLPRLGQTYCVGMVDIDHFKEFNDRHGHDVGDQVLKMVAARIKAVSGGGKSFRYGGEEFAIIFPGRINDEAVPHVEKLRAAIAGTDFALRGQDRPAEAPEEPSPPEQEIQWLSLTVSIGLAERDERYNTPQEVLKAADQALYRAKHAGRNRLST